MLGARRPPSGIKLLVGDFKAWKEKRKAAKQAISEIYDYEQEQREQRNQIRKYRK